MPSAINDVPTDQEREIAAEVAQRAMVAGWENAIQTVGKEKGLPGLVIENILNKVSAEQSRRDPSARIDELRDWQLHKQRHNSDLKRNPGGNSLHNLSPGLRAYMEKKHPHLAPHTKHPDA
jgi:hypothetical protein